MNKLTYWVAQCKDSPENYLREKTREELTAVLRALEDAGHGDWYGPAHEVEIEYTDPFDLMLACRGN